MSKLNPHKSKPGFTLVEVLIGLLMTLIVLSTMLATFFYASKEMANGRASVELSKQLVTAEELLRKDLSRLTLPPRPWMQTASAPGYFEYFEGVGNDVTPVAPGTDGKSAAALAAATAGITYLGDIDDVLAFTIRSDDEPFPRSICRWNRCGFDRGVTICRGNLVYGAF